jgi:hypothetical protein
VGVPPEGIAALNKTSAGTHQKTIDQGIGLLYAAMPEVFHQLHCLVSGYATTLKGGRRMGFRRFERLIASKQNLVRQYTWFEHYNKNDPLTIYPDDLEDPVAGRIHVDHCLETLRLSLMCYSDVTPMLFEVDPSIPNLGRKADFNVHHKCRNFDKIVDWAQENKVKLDYAQVDQALEESHHHHG